MEDKRNANIFSIAVVVLLIVIASYFTLTILHDRFGLLGGETETISEFNVEFVTTKENDVKIEVGKRLYLYDSREYFCNVSSVEYYDDYIIVKGTINGFYKNDTFFLNGNHYIAKNSTCFIMNNKTEIRILNIFS